MLYRDGQKDHRYRGFILIKNYTCFAFEIAQNSSQYALALFFGREIACSQREARYSGSN